MITKVESLTVLQNLLCIFIVLGLMTKVDTNLPLKNKNSTSNPKNKNSQPVEERWGAAETTKSSNNLYRNTVYNCGWRGEDKLVRDG